MKVKIEVKMKEKVAFQAVEKHVPLHASNKVNELSRSVV